MYFHILASKAFISALEPGGTIFLLIPSLMKKTVATFVAIITMVVALHAFRVMRQSSITGVLTPAHRAGQVWAIGNGDTLKAKHEEGSFHFTVKPGAWKLVVKGAASFHDVVVYTNAEEGKTINLGKIELQ